MLDALTSLAAGVVLVGICAIIAVWVWVMRRRRNRSNDAFAILGTTATAARARVAAPPVDLSRPIGEGQWGRLRHHASDAAYRRALETIRLRYRLVGDPMLLPNTLREAMGRSGLNFREAVIRVAEDDGLHGHR